MKTKIIVLLLLAFSFGQAQVIKSKPKSEEKTVQIEKPRAQSSDQKKIDPAIRKPEGIKSTEKEEREFVNLGSVPVTFPKKEKKRVYNVHLRLSTVRYIRGDNKVEKLGYDVFGDLFVAGVGMGKKRLICANKNGNNGCRRLHTLALNDYGIDQDAPSQQWEVNLTEEQLQDAQVIFGTDYIGFYEEGLYSDKISKGYNNKLVVNLKDVVKVSADGKSRYRFIKLYAKLRNFEAEFEGTISLKAKDISK